MQKQKVEIYTATYSGIQVFEMTVNDLDVMRRRSDSYLNATQILKLSGFDKGKRTKILEREILDSNYEKIQGGYGKYQGTWVPLERGRDLADRYEVLDLLLPLIEFDPSKWDELPEKEQLPTKSTRLRNNYPLTNIQHSTPPTSPSNTSSASDTSTNSALIKRKLTSIENEDNNINNNSNILLTPISSQTQSSTNAKKKIKTLSQGKQKQLNDNTINSDNKNKNNSNDNDNNNDNSNDHNNSDNNDNGISSQSSATNIKEEMATVEDIERYKKTMLSIFISDDDHIPPLLRGAGATNGLDMDVNIDEEGHSALHWSTSMARIHITEWLVSKGASTCKLNHKGETPLIRGVMTPNCYENECFPHMLDILKESLLLVDNYGRSVLHHIVLSTVNTIYTGRSSSSSELDSQPLTPIITSSEIRLQASICYMQTVLKVIHQLQLEYFINKVDNNGETPFAIATRLQCEELCQLLIQSDNINNKNNDHDHNSQLEGDSTINRKRSFNGDPSLMDKKISDQLKKQKKRGEKKIDKKTNKESQSIDLLNGAINSSSTKGQELAITVQRFVDAMDLEFNNKLQSREVELTRIQSEFQELSQKIEKERDEWNTSIKKNNQQLNDANIKIKQLEEMLNRSGLNTLENGINSSSILITKSNNNHVEKSNDDNGSNNHEREKQLEEKIRQLQSDLQTANIKTRKLNDMEQMYMKAVEKELGCKRLIAACCNLPMDKIDEFIEPLTLAIENDPPDMDFSRVIGFMEKLRRHQQ